MYRKIKSVLARLTEVFRGSFHWKLLDIFQLEHRGMASITERQTLNDLLFLRAMHRSCLLIIFSFSNYCPTDRSIEAVTVSARDSKIKLGFLILVFLGGDFVYWCVFNTCTPRSALFFSLFSAYNSLKSSQQIPCCESIS